MTNYSPRYSSGASNPGDISGENEGLSPKADVSLESKSKLLLLPH